MKFSLLIIGFLFVSLFTTLSYAQCTHTIRLTDGYNDGWNNGAVTVSLNGNDILALTNITMSTLAGPDDFTFTATAGDIINVRRVADGGYPSEMQVEVIDQGLNVLIALDTTFVFPGIDGIGVCPDKYPGDVSSDLKLWLKADFGTDAITDNAEITTWQDLSGLLNFTARNTPTYQNDAASLFNYNPTIDFNDTDKDYFEGASVLGNSTITESAVYVVLKTRSNGTSTSASGDGGALFNETTEIGTEEYGRFMAHYPFDAAGNSYWYNTQIDGDDWSRTTNPIDNKVELAVFNISDSNNERSISIDGKLSSNSGTQSYLPLTAANNPFYLGCGSEQSNTDAEFYSDGLIAEIAVYNGSGNLGVDRRKIESYLAIKYGLTLDNAAGGASGDYLSTNSTTIWDASTNPSYQNNIIGIGRADNEVPHISLYFATALESALALTLIYPFSKL